MWYQVRMITGKYTYVKGHIKITDNTILDILVTLNFVSKVGDYSW